MTSIGRMALVVGACILISGCGGGGDEREQPDAASSPADVDGEAVTDDRDDGSGDALADAVAGIVDEVAALRDLPPQQEVAVSVVDTDEIVEVALESSDEALERFADTEAILAALHQIPADADLEELLADLLAVGITGLYVPEDDRVYVVGDEMPFGPAERTVVAHEVVHALQDQHFDLGRLDDLAEDPDAAMALLSVAEGDAVLSQEQWAETHLSSEEQQRRRAEELEGASEQRAALDELPTALIESFLAPYSAGPEFVGALRQQGGSGEVDAALADPPSTMVEVLNPDLYASGFTPVEVDPGTAPDGWEEAESLPWGAFEVALLYELAGKEQSGAPAAWRGGQLRAWKRDGDVIAAVAWAFADAEQAGEVCGVVADWHATVADSKPAGDGVLEGPTDALALDCAGDTVRFAVAPDADAATDTLDA